MSDCAKVRAVVNPSSSAHFWKHFVSLVVGAFCIAFAPIFVVLAGRIGGVGMLDAAFWRVAIGAVVLAVVVIPRREAFPSGTRLGTWIWLPGLLFAGDFAVWHASFAHTSVANSTLLANISIVLVTLFAWWIWKEKIAPMFLVGAGIAGIGVVFLIYSSTTRGEVVPGGNPVLGDALGVATAFFYASYLLSTKAFRRSHSAPRLMFWSSSLAAIILLPIALWHSDPFLPSDSTGWWPLIAVGVISHAGGQGLIAYSLAGLPATLAAITLLLQPVATALLGWVILGQEMVPWQLAGAAAVLGGLAIAIRYQAGLNRGPVTQDSP